MDKQELPKELPILKYVNAGSCIEADKITRELSRQRNGHNKLYQAALKQLEEARQENIGHLAAIAELKKKIASDQCYHESINQALNSGNGVYKP